jgi:hypothetical protein
MAFNVPINSIAPIPSPQDWVRPSDWPVITDTPNEVQFLVCDLNAKAFTIRTTFTRTSGNIYIDWGDGVTDTISTTTATSTSHVYSTGGTPCSRGYNTWKIRIYGDATCVITNARHVANPSVTGGLSGNIAYQIGLLEAYFGNNTCTTTAFYQSYFNSQGTSATGEGVFSYLEYVKLPSVVSWTESMLNFFYDCVKLYKVIMPTSASSLTSLQSTFQGCTNLLEVNIPSNATGITTMAFTFDDCINLYKVTLPTTLNSCTTLGTCFQNTSLKNITLPSINLVTNMGFMFNNCASLQWVKFTSLPSPASSGTTISSTGMFAQCRNLQNVYFPSSCSSNAVYALGTGFSNCNSLKSIIFPTGFSASSLSSCFSQCTSLTSVTFQSAMSSLTDMGTIFGTCSLLNSVTLPTSVSASGVNMSSAFNNCVSLTSITIPSNYLITTLSSAFQSCENVTSIVLPNNSQNSCTTITSMVNGCGKLKSIVMPTSMTGLTGSNISVFNECKSLESVTLPPTMNSVTTMADFFRNCSSLKSVTLPTSVSACTNFSSMFDGCSSIETIVMPATVSASTTTLAGAFQRCFALKTLTLPTTQMSSVNTISGMLSGCGNLTTINNLNRIGSTTATPLVTGNLGQATSSPSYATLITSLSFSCPFSAFSFFGTITIPNKLNSLRLLNTGAGQYPAGSPHINISYNNLSAAALNQVFTDLPTLSGKTINITGCTGAATCTRSIATAKGWTVTG